MDVLMKSNRDYIACNFFYVTSCHCNAELLPWQNLTQNVGMSLTKATNIRRHISVYSFNIPFFFALNQPVDLDFIASEKKIIFY